MSIGERVIRPLEPMKDPETDLVYHPEQLELARAVLQPKIELVKKSAILLEGACIGIAGLMQEMNHDNLSHLHSYVALEGVADVGLFMKAKENIPYSDHGHGVSLLTKGSFVHFNTFRLVPRFGEDGVVVMMEVNAFTSPTSADYASNSYKALEFDPSIHSVGSLDITSLKIDFSYEALTRASAQSTIQK